MSRVRSIQLLFVLGFFAAGVYASDADSGFWGGLGKAFSKMGGDLSDAVTGKATKHNQTTDETVDLVVNHSMPTAAGKKAEVPVDIKEIQARLTALGYSPGPIDGAFGKKTGAAISAFQAAQGLPVDGRPSGNLVLALRSKTGGAAGNAGFIDSLASGISGLFGSRAGSPGIGRAIANGTQAMLAGKQGNSVASALVSNQLNSMLPGQVAPLVNGVAAQRQLSQPSTNISQNGLANLAASRLLGQSAGGVLGASQPQAQSYLQRMTAQQQGMIGNVIANSLETHPPAAGGMAGIGLGAAGTASAPQDFDGDLKNFPKLRKVLAEMDPPERAQLMPIALNAINKVSPTDLAMYKQAGSDVDGMLAQQIAGYAQNYKRERTHSPLTTKAPSIVRRPASALSVGNWPSSLNGAWEGDGFANLPNISNDLPKDYSRKTRVRLFFNKEKGIYETRYPGLGCSGVLKLIKSEPSPAGSAAQNILLKFRESLVTKGGFCRDGGLVEMLVKEEILPNPALPKTVKIVYFVWSHPSTHETGVFVKQFNRVAIVEDDGAIVKLYSQIENYNQEDVVANNAAARQLESPANRTIAPGFYRNGTKVNLWGGVRLRDPDAAGAALQYAYLAEAVYSDKNLPAINTPSGEWEFVSDWKVILIHGLRGKWSNDAIWKYIKEIEAKGFSATLYRREGQFVLAFRGTEPSDIRDWVADYKQIIHGKTDGGQYQFAALLASFAMAQYGDGVILTGHSLGGGLAQFAAYQLNARLNAVTFNAAGLGIYANDIPLQKNIVHFRVKGDPVSLIGNQIGTMEYNIHKPKEGFSMKGLFVSLSPVTKPFADALDNHRISTVSESLLATWAGQFSASNLTTAGGGGSW